MSRRIRPASLILASAVVIAACSAFSGKDEPPSGALPGPAADAAAGDGGLASTLIRCGGSACTTPEKCCLPFYQGDAGCVAANAVCGTDVGELLCSDPSACQAAEVCCVTAVRNGGQTGFLIAAAFCAPASACPDAPLQRSACRLGTSDQCTNGRTCKPYLSDTNGVQTLDVDHKGYATCQ